MSNMRPIKTEVDIGRIGREIIGNVEDFVLIGIPFCRRKISIQAVKCGARASWGNFNATEINITSKGHFAFHFVSQADIDRVVTRGPWVFDGVLMGFQQVKGNQRYDDVEVSKLSFWVQLHSLPLNYFREPIVRMIGETIGDVQEIKFTDEDGSSLEDIVRLRIVMDLDSFFTPAVSLKDDGKWIHVKYEKLPYICRYCGRINHADEDCNLSFDLENIPADLKTWATVPIQGLPRVHFPFGDWMCTQRYQRGRDNSGGGNFGLNIFPATRTNPSMRDRGESSSLNSVADESEPTQQDQKHEEVGGPQAVNDQNETRVSPRAGIVRGKRVMTLGEDEGMETSINALAGNEVELIANLLNKALGLSKTDLVNIIKETVKCRGSTSKAMAMAMAMAMAFNIISPKDSMVTSLEIRWLWQIF